jgi:hypothetical protein
VHAPLYIGACTHAHAQRFWANFSFVVETTIYIGGFEQQTKNLFAGDGLRLWPKDESPVGDADAALELRQGATL